MDRIIRNSHATHKLELQPIVFVTLRKSVDDELLLVVFCT